MPNKLLEIIGVNKSFGGLKATQNVSLVIPEGGVCGMVGPNGAGKSTLFNLITRAFNPDSGDIKWQGQSLLKYPAHKIVGLGLAKTSQNLSLLRLHSCLDNVILGDYSKHKLNILHSIVRTGKYKAIEKEALEKAKQKLELVGLGGMEDVIAGQLPYGQQKKLELARAMISEPKLLLLDEPATGLNPAEQKDFGKLLLSVRDQGVTIFFIEHSMKLVQQISDKVFFLNQGMLLSESDPQSLLNDPIVKELYLGRRAV